MAAAHAWQKNGSMPWVWSVDTACGPTSCSPTGVEPPLVHAGGACALVQHEFASKHSPHVRAAPSSSVFSRMHALREDCLTTATGKAVY